MSWRCNPVTMRGFTLLELLIVLAIMGLIASMVVGGRPGSAGVNLGTSAAAMASALREARAQAIAQGRPVALQVDTKTRRYGIGKALDRALPEGVSIALMTGRDDVV